MQTPELPRHSCECLCPVCEAQGAGYFAQRAALCGDTSAAKHLAPAVYKALTTRRGTLIPSLSLWICFALFWVADLSAEWLADGLGLLFWRRAGGGAFTNTALLRAALWLLAALVAHLGRSMQEATRGEV